MKRNVYLYIDGQLADIDKQTLIQMNYTMEELTNPTIVKNSYSQKVKLKGTAQNNRIFGAMYRLDRRTSTGFSAFRKTPFAIYDDLGNILERGYIKLEDITSKGSDVEYQITLYGGLGEFFYALSYREDGEKMTLADLDFFGTDHPDDELNFRINASAVQQAWEALSGAQSEPKWSIINFAPAYNGVPDNFNADVAIIRPSLAGMAESITVDGTIYSTMNGWCLVNLPEEYTEWATKDLRSYLQRPVYSIRGIIEAMCEPRNNGGYKVNLDPAFFNEDNPYWEQAWATLPILNQAEQEQVEATIGLSFTLPFYFAQTQGVYGYYNASLLGGTSNIKVTFTPTIDVVGIRSGELSLADEVVDFQIIAYGADGDAIGSAHKTISTNNNADYRGVFTGDGYGQWQWSEGAVELELRDMQNVASIQLMVYIDSEDLVLEDIYGDTHTINGYKLLLDSSGTNIEYKSFINARSGSLVTKKMLFEGGGTPADYLLSYAKLFGLHFIYDKASKEITICTRNTLYTGEVVDLSERIDYAQAVKIKPFSFDAKWYDMGFKYEEGAFAEYYEETNGRVFGRQRINTGYDFNADTKQLLDDNSYTGAVEVLEREKYFVNLKYVTGSGTRYIPSPFIDIGSEVVYYHGLDDTTELEPFRGWNTVGYWNEVFKTYDAIPKLQFHDAEGGAVEQRDVLVFLRGIHIVGEEYSQFHLSDDTTIMGQLNEGEPCWMLNGGQALTIMPMFGRYLYDGTGMHITASWDFGAPVELDIPDVSHDANAGIYPKAWAQYLADRYDVDSKVVTCKVNLQGIEVGVDLLRKFFYFDNSWWVLNKVSNYNLTGHAPVDCEFVKVKSRINYKEGQKWQ